MVLLGSRHSGSTQRIREFLSRNGQPFTYQDVETDPVGAGAARPLSRRRRRGAGGPLPRRPRPQEPEHRDAGLGGRPERRPRRGEGARGGGRRRGAGRPRRGGLRRLRGAGRAGPREQRAGRSGRDQLTHRELSRLPHRHLRPGARRPGADPGREVRGRGGDRSNRGPPRLRQPALSPHPLRRAGGPHAHDRHRDRGQVPEARRAVVRALRRRGRLLLRDLPREPALQGRGDRDRRRRQLRRTGGGVPGGHRHARPHAGARAQPVRQHVALLDPAHRQHAERRAAHAHAGRDAGGGARPRADRSGGTSTAASASGTTSATCS